MYETGLPLDIEEIIQRFPKVCMYIAPASVEYQIIQQLHCAVVVHMVFDSYILYPISFTCLYVSHHMSTESRHLNSFQLLVLSAVIILHYMMKMNNTVNMCVCGGGGGSCYKPNEIIIVNNTYSSM